MNSIVDYFNSLLSYIFGNNLILYNPGRVLNWIHTSASDASSIEGFILGLLSEFDFAFSAIVWFWFAWLSIHLLLILPFKWLRSVFKH